MPMIPVSLRKQIRSEFPYYRQRSFKIVSYIDNLLKMLAYCPNMIYDVLELILENLLLIDVNLPRDLIEDSEKNEDEHDLPGDFDDEKMKLPIAETLDLCMEKFLNYLHIKLKDDSETDKEEQKMITQAIFQYFNEQILKTYTKHVHFMVFYIASFRVSCIIYKYQLQLCNEYSCRNHFLLSSWITFGEKLSIRTSQWQSVKRPSVIYQVSWRERSFCR